MPPGLADLAEDTAVHLLPRPSFEVIERPGFVFECGAQRGSVQRVRLHDVSEAVAWTRRQAQARGLTTLEWWLGWSAPPVDEQLLALGLVPDDPPALTGMTLGTEPPPAPAHVELRPIHDVEEQLAALEVDWDVWDISPEERSQRARWERERFDAIEEAGTVHQWVALVDGRRVGFARGIDMEGGVALMGGVVAPEARGRGVYRALVRARWDHAATRGTPLLVVQAGPMSAPILGGLGFESHGEIRLFADPTVKRRPLRPPGRDERGRCRRRE
jgi:GNAT superfamily N-acetyltransferase